MGWIDSHCHLNMLDLSLFEGVMDNVLNQACSHDVEKFLTVSVDMESIPILEALATTYQNVYFSVGLHPDTSFEKEPSSDDLVSASQHEKCIAIGETGLDYYRTTDLNQIKQQQSRFEAHIQASLMTQKPLIIHTREAGDDTLAILKSLNADKVGGVMHCFTESYEFAKKALDLNFYISFSGIITFKNATSLQSTVKALPIDRILVETDAPYLAPVPFRGKQNQPAWVSYVGEMVALLKELAIEDVKNKTTDNFYRCFKLKST